MAINDSNAEKAPNAPIVPLTPNHLNSKGDASVNSKVHKESATIRSRTTGVIVRWENRSWIISKNGVSFIGPPTAQSAEKKQINGRDGESAMKTKETPINPNPIYTQGSGCFRWRFPNTKAELIFPTP
jgi:hypothetical protein